MLKALNAPRRGVLYAVIHFAVEAICFTRLYSAFDTGEYWWLTALAYDALAFVPQSFFGILTDRYPKIKAAPSGFFLMTLSLFPVGRICGMLLLGLGNALVHIAGAEATLRGANGKCAPAGIFVGGGSFGVITGQLIGKSGGIKTLLIPAVLCAAGFILTAIMPTYCELKSGGFNEASGRLSPPLITALMFVTVAARSYVGYAIPTAWNKTAWQTVMLFVCMGIGKILGGIAADKFGSKNAGTASLILSLPFLLCGNRLMAVSLIGVLFFSMTMAISLGVLASVFNDQPGFAFGITTVGLFAGSLPAFFIKPASMTAHIITVSVLTIAAAACFWLCADNKNEKARKNKCK